MRDTAGDAIANLVSEGWTFLPAPQDIPEESPALHGASDALSDWVT